MDNADQQSGRIGIPRGLCFTVLYYYKKGIADAWTVQIISQEEGVGVRVCVVL